VIKETSITCSIPIVFQNLICKLCTAARAEKEMQLSSSFPPPLFSPSHIISKRFQNSSKNKETNYKIDPQQLFATLHCLIQKKKKIVVYIQQSKHKKTKSKNQQHHTYNIYVIKRNQHDGTTPYPAKGSASERFANLPLILGLVSAYAFLEA